MRVAAFGQQSNAWVVAEILREQGYDCDVIELGNGCNPERVSEISEAVSKARWANVFIVTNCEIEHFTRIVKDHGGDVVWQGRRLRVAG